MPPSSGSVTKWLKRCFLLSCCLTILLFFLHTYKASFLGIRSNKQPITHHDSTLRQFPSQKQDSANVTHTEEITEPPVEKISELFFQPLVASRPFIGNQIINAHKFDLLIKPNVNCLHRSIDLVIGVSSGHDMFEKRTVIRKTWGDNAWLGRNNVTLLFFIGRARGGSTDNRTSENRTLEIVQTQRLIEKEAMLYRDIVQESYIDSYGNLSYKSLSIFRWVTTFCPHAKYILKADTDMYINIPLLVQTLKAHTEPTVKFNTFIMGQALPNSQPFRDPLSKWYVPYTRFNGSVYPNFVSGTAYALTTPAAKLLYEASMRVPFFWLEDVYLTGFCAVLANVTIIHSPLFSLYKLSTSGCAFRSMISGHEYSTSELETIHRELTNSSLVC